MIRDNIFRIREEIVSICRRVNRDPGEVKIIAVSKGRSEEEVKEAIAGGITDIGENRVQEAKRKYNNLRADYSGITKWHMVGHLQSNKVKEAVSIFDLIHSVDDLSLAECIDRYAEKLGKTQDILLQVNTSGEKTKFGVRLADVILLIGEMRKLRHIAIRGLMTIAPLTQNPEEIRPYFRALREIREEINRKTALLREPLTELSMGMSGDYKVALEEGSTMLRVGRAIFG